MKPHFRIWVGVVVFVLCALGLIWFRTERAANAAPAPPTPQQIVQAALDALVPDPNALEPETQAAVRAGAVVAEQGLIDSAAAFYVLGLQYQRELNTAAAELFYAQALERSPEWSWPHAALGALISRNSFGRNEEAKAHLRRAIELDPYWAKPHNSLAVILRSENNMDEAEEEARLALELSPEDVASYNNYANLLIERGRYNEAEEYYLRAIDVHPDHPKPYYNLACLYSILGRRDEALASLAEAIGRAPVLRKEAAGDPDLQALRTEALFQELVFGKVETVEPAAPAPAEEQPAAAAAEPAAKN